MKALWLTRNRRGRRAAPRLSLFPFLAVLICTMGALVLLLLSVTRQARLQAVRVASAKNAEKQSSIAAESEMVQWRIDQLKASRKDTAAQLAEARLLLGHLEDHGRRLRAQFEDLSAQAKKAAAEGLDPGRFAAPGEDELRQLENQIAEAEKQLAQSRQSAADRPKTYAIIPYEGSNSTRRRPIYIECRSDAVVLQPENIVFDESDFDEPLGPGNPLAAAVRAAREQMLMEHSLDPRNDGEPYPLLLVRPDGILAYECALAAMKSWGPDYGYELINADWQLKYPSADPNVQRAVLQAVELARQEHARLVAAAPNKYGKRPRAGAYRSSLAGQGGAGDEQGNGGGGGADSPGFYSSKPSDRYGQRYAGGGSGSANGAGGSNRPGASGLPLRNGNGGIGGNGFGTDDGGHDGGNNATDEEYAANNPYDSLSLPSGSGHGGGRGYGPSSAGYSPGGTGYGSGGAGYGPGGMGGGAGGVGTGYPGGMASGPGGAGGGYAGGAGSNMNGGGSQGTNGSPNGGSTGGGGTGGGSNGGGGNGGSAGGDGMAGGDPGAGSPGAPGSPGAAAGGMSNAYSPTFGQQGSQGGGQAGSGQSGMQGAAQSGAQSNGQATYQATGQQVGTASAAGMARPDGYITGQPLDANPNPPPLQRSDPSSGVAMVADSPLRPGEWRPSNDPPKPDPEEAKKKKKKHPYDDVEPDHNQADWALRDARRHAAAISRPVHVDCYSDRVVIAPEQPGGEPHVVVCGSDSQRNADKLVAAVWELMDTWGMAGKDMYWRPVLNFYVVPGAEPRMTDLTRALDGSGLVIERKR